jgi:aerotolerance regulator-like protein
MSSFSFLNPAFLWALPAVAIPILIHFLSRRRLPEIRFPTVMFLRALEPREIRRLRLRELLLLLLRTLAMLLIVCAFARPSVEPKGATVRAAVAVAVIVDDSESMGAMDEQARPRIEGARERGLLIVDAARAGDEIAITTTTGPDAPLVSRSGDRLRLTRTVRQIETTWFPGRMDLALERARRFLARSTLRSRELYIVGDFQASNFTREAREKIAQISRAGARVTLLPVVSSRVPNHAIEDLDPELRPGPQGKGLEMRARITNHSDAPSERLAVRARRGDALIGGGDVTLQAEESRWASLPIDWRAGAAQPASAVTVVSDPGGKSPVVVESDVDALAGDDRRYAVLGAPKRLRVLRVVESRAGAPASRFTALALDPAQDGSGGYAIETGTPASLLGLSRGRTDVVLLEDIASLSGDAEARLRAYLREGGGLVVALGPHADPDYYGRTLFPGMIDLALEGIERATEGQAFEMRARAPAHPILEGLSLTVGSTLTQSKITALARGRTTSTRADVVVSTTGGLPVVVASPQVAVFLGSLSDDWGDLPYSGAFVPLVRGLVDYTARAASSDLRGKLFVGRPPAAYLESAPSGGIFVRGPESYRSQATVVSEGSGFRAVADAPAPAPGFYVFEAGAREAAVVAVNPDPIESDLMPIQQDSLRAGLAEAPRTISTTGSLRSYLRDTRQGRELWLLFLTGAAIFLAAELALGSARITAP